MGKLEDTARDAAFVQKKMNENPSVRILVWIVAILAILALIIAIVIFLVDGGKGKHVSLLWGLSERNIPKGYPDTVFAKVPVHDTVYIAKQSSPTSQPSSKSTIPRIDQKNNSGDNNSNSGVNNGNIGGSNNTVINEPHLTTQDKENIESEIVKLFVEHNLTKANLIILSSQIGGNGQKFASQVATFLKSKGYNVWPNTYNSNVMTDRYKVIMDDGSPTIRFGLF